MELFEFEALAKAWHDAVERSFTNAVQKNKPSKKEVHVAELQKCQQAMPLNYHVCNLCACLHVSILLFFSGGS